MVNSTGPAVKILYLNCDLEEDLSSIDTISLTVLKKLTSDSDYIFIDEAQRIEPDMAELTPPVCIPVSLEGVIQ